jgi:hypothetical protein
VPDIVLHWPFLSTASDQSGLSRLYGGIHFEDGDLQGRILGRKVGTQAASKAFSLFQGKTDFVNPYQLKFGDNTDETLQADITGLASNSQLVGAKLYAYGGNDTLWGGTKRIEMFGGEGADTFVLIKDFTPDIIRDFNPDEGDKVAVSKGSFGSAIGSVGSTVNVGASRDFRFDSNSSSLFYHSQPVARLDGIHSLSQLTVVA